MGAICTKKRIDIIDLIIQTRPSRLETTDPFCQSQAVSARNEKTDLEPIVDQQRGCRGWRRDELQNDDSKLYYEVCCNGSDPLTSLPPLCSLLSTLVLAALCHPVIPTAKNHTAPVSRQPDTHAALPACNAT